MKTQRNPRSNTKKSPRPQAAPKIPSIGPEPAAGSDDALFDYLSRQRGIPAQLIRQLIDQGLLYRSRDGQAVFANAERTFTELDMPGPDDDIHEVRAAGPGTFWSFKADGPDSVPELAYICGSAIDAVSLYLDHNPHIALYSPAVGLGDDTLAAEVYMPQKPPRNVLYCSVGDLADQERIDQVKAALAEAGIPARLAVGWDEAGRECLRRNRGTGAVVTRRGDWNEYLRLGMREDLISRLPHVS